MVKIIIDDQELEASPGDMIIEVADAAGIYIPRFCYHKKLSIAANCRMCLVQIAQNNKTVPACATPIMDGMQIYTKSKLAVESQRAVMEFLLVNHPLDCPICDQGGECELQDLSMGYGNDYSKFNETKRVVPDYDIGPLITTNMTRCIHCTRCIRFGKEVAGVQEFGLINRGDRAEVRTYVNEAVKSNLSGNLIDICPVGALNSKPYAYQARSWELISTSSIAPHDCLGSSIDIHTRQQEIFRVVAKENDEINETWISDRDRFSYLGVHHSERLNSPYVKEHGRWHYKNWHDAIKFIAKRLKSNVQKFGATQLAGIISPSSTLEELYLFQKLVRGLGSNNIDHRVREQDISDQANRALAPTCLMSNYDLENSDIIFIFAANVEVEQPLLTVTIRNAVKNGAKVYVMNPIDHDFNFKISGKIIVDSFSLPKVLSQLVKCGSSTKSFLNIFTQNKESPEVIEFFNSISSGKKTSIITGSYLYQHENASILRAMIIELQSQLSAQIMHLTYGSNYLGAWLSGCIPHREPIGKDISSSGFSVLESFDNNLQTYCIFGLEPEFDCIFPGDAIKALKNASLVIMFSPYITDAMLDYADVILPISTFAETSGTFINIFGNTQKIKNAIQPLGDSKPGWEILSDLSDCLEIINKKYDCTGDVYREIEKQLQGAQFKTDEEADYNNFTFENTQNGFNTVFEWPIYSIDSIVRRSSPLQAVNEFANDMVYINSKDAVRYSLSHGDNIVLQQESHEFHIDVGIDNKVPSNSIYIPLGIPGTMSLKQGKIEIKKC